MRYNVHNVAKGEILLEKVFDYFKGNVEKQGGGDKLNPTVVEINENRV